MLTSDVWLHGWCRFCLLPGDSQAHVGTCAGVSVPPSLGGGSVGTAPGRCLCSLKGTGAGHSSLQGRLRAADSQAYQGLPRPREERTGLQSPETLSPRACPLGNSRSGCCFWPGKHKPLRLSLGLVSRSAVVPGGGTRGKLARCAHC